MIAISIIIPVYNSAKYIRECLDSILKQGFNNYEVILIDDGSTDDSLTICEEYSKKYSNFSITHKANEGVSIARNIGIQLAKGQWLYFCDSDDKLLDNCLELLWQGTREEVDLVNYGYIAVNEVEQIVRKVPNHPTEIIRRDEMVKRLLFSREYNYQGNLWCKLFRAETIKKHNLLFDPQIYYNEDRLFIAQYICRSSGVVYFSTKPVYEYFERKDSAMGRAKEKFNPKFITDVIATVNIVREIKKSGCSFKNIYYWKILCFSSYMRISKQMGENNSTEKIQLRNSVIKGIGLVWYLLLTIRYNLKK